MQYGVHINFLCSENQVREACPSRCGVWSWGRATRNVISTTAEVSRSNYELLVLYSPSTFILIGFRILTLKSDFSFGTLIARDGPMGQICLQTLGTSFWVLLTTPVVVFTGRSDITRKRKRWTSHSKMAHQMYTGLRHTLDSSSFYSFLSLFTSLVQPSASLDLKQLGDMSLCVSVQVWASMCSCISRCVCVWACGWGYVGKPVESSFRGSEHWHLERGETKPAASSTQQCRRTAKKFEFILNISKTRIAESIWREIQVGPAGNQFKVYHIL